MLFAAQFRISTGNWKVRVEFCPEFIDAFRRTAATGIAPVVPALLRYPVGWRIAGTISTIEVAED